MKLPSSTAVRIVAIILGCVFFSIGIGYVGAQSVGGDGGKKRALMIGINAYRAAPKLQGSLNDIQTIRQVLITRWGFHETDIQLLTDEKATREGILSALKQFVTSTAPHDTVYIHYSGHGSQVADLNGDEAEDGLDETIVPHDGRTGSIPDITDDELKAILSKLPTKNALIVLDSCHSGTATRSLEIRTRSIPQDTRIELYEGLADSEFRTRGNVQALPAPYILMTGAAANQEALDGPIDGRFHGFFSYALSKSLGSAGASASARDIFRGVEMEFKRLQIRFGRASMPEPQLEAPIEYLEKPVFGYDTVTAGLPSSSRLAWVDVKLGAAGKVILTNGLMLGAAPGSIWAIYPPGDTKFQPGQAIATATVTQLVGQDAHAKLYPATQKVPEGSRAVAYLGGSGGEKIPIRLLDVPPARRKQIEQTLQYRVPGLVLVESEQSPRFLVTAQGNSIKLLAADSLHVVGSFEGDGDGWAAGLAMVVSRSVTASELLTLDNPSSQLRLEVRLANAKKANNVQVGTRGIALVAAHTKPGLYTVKKAGEPRTRENSLQLEITTNLDSYVSIVDVDSEGRVSLLFPNSYAKPDFLPSGLIQAGVPTLIPDSLLDSNKAGFVWDYSPPTGIDTIHVFCTTDLQTANVIRRRIQSFQGGEKKFDEVVLARSFREQVGLIREDLAESAIRGVAVVQGGKMKSIGSSSGSPPASEMPRIQSGSTVERPAIESGASSGPPPDWAVNSITIKVEG
jgi:hypothetical protein